MPSYVFILSPPHSGSTVLWKLLSTSSAISALPGEGQFVPEVREVMRRSPWNSDTKLPWATIKNVWDSYWDQEKALLLEKSPPNIIRATEIEEYFRPVYFLLMVRNPYAHCEGLIRSNRLSADRAATVSARCLRQQMVNAANLKNVLRFTYEELVEAPETMCERIESFIPSIGVLERSTRFKLASIDGTLERGIVNLNQQQIDNLSGKSVAQINSVLERHRDVMQYWGYEFYEPSLNHSVAFIKRRSGLLASSTVARGRNRIARMTKRLTARSH